MKRLKIVARSLLAVGALCCIAFPAAAHDETSAGGDWREPQAASSDDQQTAGASKGKKRASGGGAQSEAHPHKRKHSRGSDATRERRWHHEAGSGHGHAHDSAPSSHAHGGEPREALTEFLFGFVAGSDIPDPFHKHISFDVNADFGKASGSYAAVFDHVELGFVPWRDFHVGLGASYAYHRILGVRGLEEQTFEGSMAPALLHRDNGDFDGLNLEFRQRFLDREQAPFGLTLVAEPHWARVEEVSGAPVNKHAVGFLLAADKDIVRDTLFVAFNAFYEPEWVQLTETRDYERESTAGLAASGMVRLSPSLFAGADVRYFRTYEGAALNAFAGEALFAGPNVFAILGDFLVTAAYEAQLWGHVPGQPGALDLENFTRCQTKLRVVAHF